MATRRTDERTMQQTCLCLAVQRAGRAVGRRFDEVFRPLDLTNWQFSLLASLDGARKPIGGLAAELGADRTTMTANLKPLERRGLIEIGSDAADRRTKLVALTEAGRALLEQAKRSWAEIDQDMDKRLSGLDRAGFIEALRSLSSM